MTTLLAADEITAGAAVLDFREQRPDPARCPLALPHWAGGAGCAESRRAMTAKGLKAPAGGWPCPPPAADRPHVEGRR